MNPRIAAAILLILTTAPSSAQQGTVHVPDGRELRRHKVLTLGLTDRWELDLARDEFVRCIVETGEFDPVLELVDEDGESYARDDGEGSRSEIAWFAPKDGHFAFTVQGYEGRGGGGYSITILRFRTERLAAHAAAEHTFGPERWWHWRVPMQKGDVIVPRVPFGGTLTAVLDLRQQRLPEWHGAYTATADGDVLLRVEGNERDRCRIDVQPALQYELDKDGALHDEVPEGGMHIVRHEFAPGAWTLELDTPQHELAIDFRDTAPGRNPRFGWTGMLDKNGRRRQWMLVREPMRAELVLRNHLGAASYRGRFVQAGESVAFGVPVTAQLPLGGGRLFRFEAVPGQLLRIAAASRAFDVRLDLHTPDMGVHRFDDGARLDLDAQHTFLVRQRGIHHALVYTSGGAGSGAFEFQVETLPIPELAFDTPLPVQVDSAGAFVHLTCEPGRLLWLSVESKAFDPALLVFDPDGAQVMALEGGGIGWNVLNGFEAREGGIYTLQVLSRQGRGDGTLRAIRP